MQPRAIVRLYNVIWNTNKSTIIIANKYEIPISYIGLGEKIEDLVSFDSQNFARSILNLEEKKWNQFQNS